MTKNLLNHPPLYNIFPKYSLIRTYFFLCSHFDLQYVQLHSQFTLKKLENQNSTELNVSKTREKLDWL
jgi:hypothetical protein